VKADHLKVNEDRLKVNEDHLKGNEDHLKGNEDHLKGKPQHGLGGLAGLFWFIGRIFETWGLRTIKRWLEV